MKIKAAVDARNESGSDIVIVARSDARQGVSLEEALWRTNAYAEAGADVIFIDALNSVEEMKTFCQVAPHVPHLVRVYVVLLSSYSALDTRKERKKREQIE